MFARPPISRKDFRRLDNPSGDHGVRIGQAVPQPLVDGLLGRLGDLLSKTNEVADRSVTELPQPEAQPIDQTAGEEDRLPMWARLPRREQLDRHIATDMRSEQLRSPQRRCHSNDRGPLGRDARDGGTPTVHRTREDVTRVLYQGRQRGGAPSLVPRLARSDMPCPFSAPAVAGLRRRAYRRASRARPREPEGTPANLRG